MTVPFKSAETPEFREAIRALITADPDLAKARDLAGALPDRRRAPGFETLLLLIVEQQVSIASARAIWARLVAGLSEVTPKVIAAETDEALRGFGLSRPKVRYARILAEAVLTGELPLDEMDTLSDAEAMRALTAVTGIGRWTAEVYLLFALGRRDIFPVGDVALQAAAQDIKGLPERPDARALDRIAEQWRPHRGVAAQLLWRYYGVSRGRADPVAIDNPDGRGA